MRPRSLACVVLVLVVAVLAAAVGAARAQAITFQSATPYPVGTGARAVVTGDFNGDGKQDIVVANMQDSTVSLLLGDGKGGFGSQRVFATNGLPRGLAVGDFNGDGRRDLVAADYGVGAVSVLLGNGSGGFSGPFDFAAAQAPTSVAVGDFNGDGKQDIVTANEGADPTAGGTVSVLLGTGSGTFGAHTDFPTGATPFGVATADLNGDGRLDLVTANYTANTVSVLFGYGNGRFGPATSYPTGANPFAVVIGDFNNDGKKDLAVADSGADAVTVLYGNGTGGFTARADFSAGPFPSAVAVADLNGDGLQDLVTSDYNADAVSVLMNSGGGSFAAPALFGTGRSPTGIAVADFNGDHLGDLVTSDLDDNTASVLLQQAQRYTIAPSVVGGVSGHGTISPSTAQIVNAGATPTFTFVPAAGYKVSRVAVDGTAVAMTGPNSYTFPAVFMDHTIAVTFAPAGTTPTLTITAPTGTSSYLVGGTLTVNWMSDVPVSSGEFGVWVRSSTNSWYLGKTVPASGDLSFTTSLTLNVPVGSGYQAIVAWRATPGFGTWGSWATSPGSFSVTSTPTVTITAPSGSATYAHGATLAVTWTSDVPVSSGEFGVWVRSSTNSWYIAKLVPASGGTGFSTNVVLNVPAGSGYQAIVAWRVTPGFGTWGSWATEAGSFTVQP